jgi:hypothetical protein
MKLFELKIEDEEVDEVFALSLVENPAIEADWVFFSKDGKKEEVKFATIDSDKRLIVAPVLIPEKQILRIDEKSGEEYRVFFTADTVEKLAQNYLKKGYQDKATIEHGKNIDGKVTVVESWVSKSSVKDKSALYFNRAFPIGTWFITMKVNDDNLWQNYVKTGIIKAISLEGIFSHQLVKQSMVESIMLKDIDSLTEGEVEILLSKIAGLFESYSDYGQEIRNNAKRGIELNDKVGNKCATQTGKVRAQQIANGEKLSVETIKRMYSYLSRAEVYYDETDTTACGTISYLLWGGKSALSWSRNKLSELGLLEEAAEVGPRGGIKESPKAPKSGTPNPNPKGEGTAKGDASGKSAKVTAEQEKTLEGKVKEFNEKESNTKNGNATLGQLKSVFQRGLGAFNTSHSPAVKSAEQWAYARVNAFLYLLKNGRPENAKYTTDYDLLPKGHPKADTKLEAQPSITSTYPGESAEGKKKYKAPALLVEGDMCPEATQNVKINLENRQYAIDSANYGPLNPNEPNEDYWKAKADQFKGDLESAKKALCGNCAFFVQTKSMLECIAGGINDTNEWDTIEAGDLGYCEAFDFKCAADRTCAAWVVGGPITD